MKSITLSLVALVFISLGGVPTTAVAQTQEQPAPQVQATEGQVVLRVDGLTCPFCAFGLEKKLTRLEAVDEVEINIRDGRVTLTLEEGASVSDAAIEKAVKDAGFTVRQIVRPGSRIG